MKNTPLGGPAPGGLRNPANRSRLRDLFANSPKLSAAEKREALAALQHFEEPEMDNTINAALQQVGADLKRYAQRTDEGLEELRARTLEVEQAVASGNRGRGSLGVSAMSVGAAVLAEINQGNSAFQHLAAGNHGSVTFRLPTRIHAITNQPGTSSDGGSMPSDPSRGALQGQVLRPLTLLDALPVRPTDRDSVEFVQLGSTGDAAEQEEEGEEKARADFDGELKRAQIATIALWTPASKQVLSDHRALQGQIDRVLRHKCAARLEYLVVNGGTGSDGTSKISGLIENSTVFVPTIGGDPADVIGEAISAMRTNGYSPDLIVMHPRDWHRIQITKTETEADYKVGSPTNPLPPSLWGLPIVATPAVAEGEAMVLDRSFTDVLDREAAGVQISNSHTDYFTRNLVAILGELRAGLEVRDVAAVLRVDLESTSGL